MTRKIFALMALSVVLSACESTETEPATQKPTPAVQASPTPATSASPEPGTSPGSQLKTGDKVKAVNGSFNEATVISVDEKSAKVTIKIVGQAAEKTVALSEVVKQ